MLHLLPHPGACATPSTFFNFIWLSYFACGPSAVNSLCFGCLSRFAIKWGGAKPLFFQKKKTCTQYAAWKSNACSTENITTCCPFTEKSQERKKTQKWWCCRIIRASGKEAQTFASEAN